MQINAINIDPEIMGGTPVFSGTRVPVQSLFDWLETETLDEFLENFPTVSKESFGSLACRRTVSNLIGNTVKILLDENLPKNLQLEFSREHKIFTVREKGWNGKRNGELLNLMTLDGFDALITIDKNLQFQLNLSRFPIEVFILNAPNNKIATLIPYLENLKLILDKTEKNQVQIIEVR